MSQNKTQAQLSDRQGPTRNFQWYLSLKKPSINPPQWVFPVVWTTLYIMIGLSFYFYLKDTNFEYTNGLIVFFIQLGLNLLWTPIFFWKKMITAAFVQIILMWIMILTTIIFFYERSHFAAYLLMPYLTWVTLATYLNGFIAMNNPDPSLQKDSKQKAKRQL